MARREYARIGVDMPEEESIKALPIGAQWLYDRLLLRPEISRCGVIPWRPGVVAGLAPDATEKKVRAWARQLEPRRHIVLDDAHAEVLVRTFVKHDKLLAQPNVVPHLVYDFALISSPKVRIAFLQEMRRLWTLTADDDFTDSERGGWLLAVGHYPMRKDPENPAHRDLRWPIALDARTLARLVKEIGPGLRTAMTSAIAAGHVEPFTADDPAGIPDPFQGPHRGTPSPHPTPTPLPGTPPPRAHTRAQTETETETGYSVPPTTETVSVSPDDVPPNGKPAAPAADTHTQAAQLVDKAGRVTGAVRLALVHHTTELLDEGHTPHDVAAAITDWRQKPGSGAGLLPWLLSERLIRRDNANAKRNGHDNHRPPWCGTCDETTRTEPVNPDDDTGAYRRCPRCHPTASTDQPKPDTTPVPALTFGSSHPDEPPF